MAAAVENLRAGMVNPDKALLSSLTFDALSYGHSSGKVEDKNTFISVLTSGENDFVTLDLSDQTINIVGNTALVRHTLSAKTNDGGNPGNVKLGVLTVWQKDNGKWKLLARQACKLTQ